MDVVMFSATELFKVPHGFVAELTKSTIALFVVIDPIGNIPVFMSLTGKMDRNRRKGTSRIAIITAASLLILFAVGGTQILSIFGINIHSFMIVGGYCCSFYR